MKQIKSLATLLLMGSLFLLGLLFVGVVVALIAVKRFIQTALDLIRDVIEIADDRLQAYQKTGRIGSKADGRRFSSGDDEEGDYDEEEDPDSQSAVDSYLASDPKVDTLPFEPKRA